MKRRDGSWLKRCADDRWARGATTRATFIFAHQGLSGALRHEIAGPLLFDLGRTARGTLGGARETPVARVEGRVVIGDSMRRKPSQGVAGARDVPRDDVRLDGIPRLGANQRPRLTRPRPPRPTPPRLAGVRNAYAAHADGATGFYVDEGSTYTNPHDGGVREALVRAVRAWPDLFAPADQPGTADDRVLDLSCGSGEVTAALVAAGVHLDRIDACDPYTGAAYERRIGKKCANIPAPRTPRVVHGDAFPLLQGRTRESIPRWRPVRWILTHENLPRRSIPHSPEPRRGPSRTSRAASSPTEAGARSSVPSPCTSALEITSRRCA